MVPVDRVAPVVNVVLKVFRVVVVVLVCLILFFAWFYYFIVSSGASMFVKFPTVLVFLFVLAFLVISVVKAVDDLLALVDRVVRGLR